MSTPSTSHTLELSCPAKVNFALSIGAPLPAGGPHAGFHPLASWMVVVNFGDRMSLQVAEGNSRFDLAFAPEAPVPAVVDWPLEKDLVYRAHQLLEAHAGRPLPVRLTLRKLIPPGAGLGGGSSDAAAALVGIHDLHDLRLADAQLMALGDKLGSDVPFLVGAMRGQTSAIVTGLGEAIEVLPRSSITHLVLIFPPFGCPTGPVYQAYDRLHPADTITHRPEIQRVRQLAAMSPLPQDGPFNDLLAPACDVRPELASLMASLRQTLDLPVHMSGSGSTLFVISPSDITAKATARRITTTTGLPAVATRTR